MNELELVKRSFMVSLSERKYPEFSGGLRIKAIL